MSHPPTSSVSGCGFPRRSVFNRLTLSIGTETCLIAVRASTASLSRVRQPSRSLEISLRTAENHRKVLPAPSPEANGLGMTFPARPALLACYLGRCRPSIHCSLTGICASDSLAFLAAVFWLHCDGRPCPERKKGAP